MPQFRVPCRHSRYTAATGNSNDAEASGTHRSTVCSHHKLSRSAAKSWPREYKPSPCRQNTYLPGLPWGRNFYPHSGSPYPRQSPGLPWGRNFYPHSGSPYPWQTWYLHYVHLNHGLFFFSRISVKSPSQPRFAAVFRPEVGGVLRVSTDLA